VTRRPDEIRAAERVIFPGVGAAGASMESLARLGLADELRAAFDAGKPILGICIGCQVIFEESEEDGGVRGLGLLPGRVARFRFPAGTHCKVPHMGWNRVSVRGPHPVFRGLEGGGEFYFVHSYYPVPGDDRDVIGVCDYGGVVFPAALARDNLAAVQFHAEKSGRLGLQVLKNFLDWSP
jgi:glutamine amidotransferase